jgi:hypothetical protein
VAVAACTLLTASLVGGAPPSGALIDVVSGVLEPSDPTTQLVNVSFNDCAELLAPTVHYDSVPFVAEFTGTYEFIVTEGAEYTALYLYSGGFDDTNPTANCIRASNGNIPQFKAHLTADSPYTLVIIDASEEQTGGAWTIQGTDPGGLGGTGPTTTTTTASESTTSTSAAAPTAVAPRSTAATAVERTPSFTG